MTPTRFCLVLVIAGLGLAAAVAMFNLLVDPYLLFDQPRLAGFSDRKPAVKTRERLMKAYAAPRGAPRTLILGSSRSDVGIDPSHPVWPASRKPVYNLSLAGADTGRLTRYLQHLVALNDPALPRTLIVGLDFEYFLYRPGVAADGDQAGADETEERLAVLENGQPNRARIWRLAKDYGLALWSLDALADSLATIAASRAAGSLNITADGHMDENDFRGTVAADGVAALFAQKDVQTIRQYGRSRQCLSGRPGGPIPRLATVEKLIDVAKARGMTVLLAIQPAHADRLELLDHLGYWDDFERWKRALAELVAAERRAGADVTLWDFGGYEAFSQERIPAMGDRRSRLQWFWDPVHYTSTLGDIMVARMLGLPTPVDYGVVLTPERVDQRLTEIRQDREAYRAREPGESLRLAGYFCDKAAECGKEPLELVRARTAPVNACF